MSYDPIMLNSLWGLAGVGVIIAAVFASIYWRGRTNYPKRSINKGGRYIHASRRR